MNTKYLLLFFCCFFVNLPPIPFEQCIAMQCLYFHFPFFCQCPHFGGVVFRTVVKLPELFQDRQMWEMLTL